MWCSTLDQIRTIFERKPTMSYIKFRWSLLIALLVTQGLHAQSMPYATVTDERLQHPEAGDWLMYRRTYDGSGFSPLKQITAANIGKLSLAWSVNTDLVEAHETTPIVNHGRMFVTTPQNNVIAYNAKTGVELWRYAKKYPEGLFQLHPTNRGVALYGKSPKPQTNFTLVSSRAASTRPGSKLHRQTV